MGGLPWPGLVLVGFVVVLVALGGASRADAMSQPFVRIAAVAVSVAMLWQINKEQWLRVRQPALFLAAFVTMCALQLIPLPPGLWSSLPGRDDLADLLRNVGLPLGWRPISLAPDLTLNALLATLPAFAIVLCLAPLPRSQIEQGAPLVLFVVMAICALLGLLQVSTGGPYQYRITNWGTPVGIFANRNHTALFLAMGFPLLAVWVLQHWRDGKVRARLLVAASGAVAIVAMLLVNGSRGGILVAGVGLAGAFFLFLREGDRIPRRSVLAGFGALALVTIAVGVAFISAARDLALSRIGGSDAEEERLEALPTVLQIAGDFFPFGAGFGTFDPVFRMAEPDERISPVYFNHAHNDFLEIVIEGGLLGVILLAAFIGWAAWRSVRAWQNGTTMAAAASIIMMQVALFSIFDYPLRVPLLSSLLALFAVVLSLGKERSRRVGSDGEFE